MADNRCSGIPEGAAGRIKEAVCIDTNRIYDSCADKDCLADLRVMFTNTAQSIIDKASSIRCRGCEIINAFIDVESVPFNRGCYSVDITYFFKIYIDVYTTPVAPAQTVCGLTTFSKKCILYGSEGNVRVFTSEYSADEFDEQLHPGTTTPRAKVQAVDPICLEAKLCNPSECCMVCCEGGVPRSVARCFDGDFCCQSKDLAVKVTLGLFTIVQLERDVQMLIPAYDFCIPSKECCFNSEDPCDAFKKINFPLNEFFPPNARSLERK